MMDKQSTSNSDHPSNMSKPGRIRRLESLCFAFGCNTIGSDGFSIHTIQMPGEGERFTNRQKLWIKFIGRKRKFDFKDARYYKRIGLCSGHFKQEEFEYMHVQMFRHGIRTKLPPLKKDAVPSIDVAKQPFPPDWFVTTPPADLEPCEGETSPAVAEPKMVGVMSAVEAPGRPIIGDVSLSDSHPVSLPVSKKGKRNRKFVMSALVRKKEVREICKEYAEKADEQKRKKEFWDFLKQSKGESCSMKEVSEIGKEYTQKSEEQKCIKEAWDILEQSKGESCSLKEVSEIGKEYTQKSEEQTEEQKRIKEAWDILEQSKGKSCSMKEVSEIGKEYTQKSEELTEQQKRIKEAWDILEQSKEKSSSMKAGSRQVDLTEDGRKVKPRATGNRCVTYGCSNTFHYGFILHKMPGCMPAGQEEFDHIQKRWISFIGRKRKFDETMARKYVRIYVCSGHFRLEDYDDMQLAMYRRQMRRHPPALKKDAVPSVDNARQPFPPDWFLPMSSAHLTQNEPTSTSSSNTSQQNLQSAVSAHNSRVTGMLLLSTVKPLLLPLNARKGHPYRGRKVPACTPEIKKEKKVEDDTRDDESTTKSCKDDGSQDGGSQEEQETASQKSVPKKKRLVKRGTKERKKEKKVEDDTRDDESTTKSCKDGGSQDDGSQEEQETASQKSVPKKKKRLVKRGTKERKKEKKVEDDTRDDESPTESHQDDGSQDGGSQEEQETVSQESVPKKRLKKEKNVEDDTRDDESPTKSHQDDGSQDGGFQEEQETASRDSVPKKRRKKEKNVEDDTGDDESTTESCQEDGSQDGGSQEEQETASQKSEPRKRRGLRRCGHCKACRKRADCGRCDFCLDKIKFGGENRIRQKCRFKQCLTMGKANQFPRKRYTFVIPRKSSSSSYSSSSSSSSSEESETEQEIVKGIEKMKERSLLEEKQREQRNMEDDDDDDRSSLFLSSSSSSSSSGENSSSPPSPVHSPKRQSPLLSSSGFEVLPERQAKVATIVNMIDRIGKGKETPLEDIRERGDEPKEPENALAFCLCKGTDYSQFIISCDYCAKLYHGKCVGVEELAAKFIEKYACPPCRDKHPYLTVVYKENGTDPSSDVGLAGDETDEGTERTFDLTKSKKNNKNKERGVKTAVWERKRKVDCGMCIPCTKKRDCGECIFCKDKVRFGGTNIKKQKCMYRKCEKRYRKPSTQPRYEKSKLPKQSFIKYQRVSYDTSKIDNPEVRSLVSYEIQYHHDYAFPGAFYREQKDDDVVAGSTEKKTESLAKKKKKKKKKKKERKNPDWILNKKERKKKIKQKKFADSVKEDVPPLQKKQRRKGCGDCEPCKRTEDCRICVFCKDKASYGGANRLHQKCRLRQCKSMFHPKAAEHSEVTNVLPVSPKAAAHTSGTNLSPKSVAHTSRTNLSPKAATQNSRTNLVLRRRMTDCGECVACRTINNCGSCVFCLDKRQFGGRSMWRQKCIFKHCLVRTNWDVEECGSCIACKRSKDCKQCAACKRNRKYGRVRKYKCILRICLKKYTKYRKPTKPVIVLDDEDEDAFHSGADAGGKEVTEGQALKSSTCRLLEALPDQIMKWKRDPNFAGVEWGTVERSLEEIKRNLARVDVKMERLQQIIAKPKKLSISEFRKLNEEELSPRVTRGPPVIAESKLADYLDDQQSRSVMKVRIMYHGGNQNTKKNTRRDVCGCPLEADTLPDTDLYCPLPKSRCEEHYNWEKLRQAEIDLERMVWLMKLDELLDLGKGNRPVTTTNEASATAVS